MSPGWYFARLRDDRDARVQAVRVTCEPDGDLRVAVAGDDRQFLPSDFEWLGEVLPCAHREPENYADPIARRLIDLVRLMTARGFEQPCIGVTLSATPEGVTVGLYLHPAQNRGASLVAPDFTVDAVRWAERQVMLMSSASQPDDEPA